MNTAVDTWLALPGADRTSDLAAKSRALRLGVLVCIAADLLYDGVWLFGLPLLACTLACFHAALVRAASALALALITALLVVSVPVVANHDYLKWILVSLLVLLRPDDAREQRLLLLARRARPR